MVAKNAPTGSYAAGCPAQGSGHGSPVECSRCDRRQ